jgi:hypothetical protein
LKHTLDFYFYAPGNRANRPVAVRSESDLERTLKAVLNNRQPHPTQVTGRELPTFGPAEIPTRLFKIDTAYTGEHAALHYAGPADPRTAAGVVEAWMLGATTEDDQVFSEQIYDLVRANVASAAPSDMEPDDAAWVTRVVDDVPQDVPTLYIDKANETEFPRDAIIPMPLLRLALLEFQVTGLRPESVRWQPVDVY